MLVEDAALSSSAALRTDEVVLDDEKTAREYKLDSAEGCILGLCFVDTSVVSPSPVFFAPFILYVPASRPPKLSCPHPAPNCLQKSNLKPRRQLLIQQNLPTDCAQLIARMCCVQEAGWERVNIYDHKDHQVLQSEKS